MTTIAEGQLKSGIAALLIQNMLAKTFIVQANDQSRWMKLRNWPLSNSKAKTSNKIKMKLGVKDKADRRAENYAGYLEVEPH